MIKQGVIILIIILTIGCKKESRSKEKSIKVAFLSDVHLLDVKGTLQDIGYDGINNPKTGQKAFIRTMEAQLHSTRLFNENYFAFLAALDDVVKKGIKLVALPGDFSDDGQPINVRGLNRILNEYSKNHGLSFFIITGNHDPTSPFGEDGGKRDFLGSEGQPQPIMSKKNLYTAQENELPVIVSEDIRKMGYSEIVNELSSHGFFPLEKYRYWETPFTTYTYDEYSLEVAQTAAALNNRVYRIAENTLPQPDVSYLVEPVDGLWLVAIDANVYLPKENGEGYHGASIGYNQVIEHKEYLVNWVKKISAKAEKLGKSIIAFSHYPMIEFNDGASEQMKQLFGERSFQAHRIPHDTVAKLFADAGLKVHIGGHMHLNDTGIIKTEKGNTLINLQVPSLAAYKPAYKILEIQRGNAVNVETVTLDSVPGFNEFFSLYELEHNFLKDQNSVPIWKRDILSSQDYREFTQFHLEELIRLRFLPSDWPESLKDILLNLNGQELYILSNIDADLSQTDLKQILTDTNHSVWQQALNLAKENLEGEEYALKDFSLWHAEQMIIDFYRLRSADELALRDIPDERIEQYQKLIESLLKNESPLLKELQLFGSIFEKQLQGEPANNFSIDLIKGTLTPN